jgi:two-component system, LytTR family, response regulator
VVQRNENDRSEQEKQMIRELGQLRERKLLIHNQDGIHVIPMEQIIRLEADNNYTTFYLVNAQKIVSAKTLKDYDVTLSNFNFIRCHQTHLVNLHHIVKYNNRDGGHLVMSDGDKVPVSQRKRMDVLNQLSGKIL